MENLCACMCEKATPRSTHKWQSMCVYAYIYGQRHMSILQVCELQFLFEEVLRIIFTISVCFGHVELNEMVNSFIQNDYH